MNRIRRLKMNAENVIKIVVNHNFTRREFLSTSCMALSGTAFALSVQKLPGRESTTSDAMPNIDPGYIGPQFFDEREEQALLDVLESRSPFRYWGPGNPAKVLRFEEKFAEYMGARFAIGVTSGTAALDCAVAGLGIGPGEGGVGPACP